jgi:RNA polymerase sigma-70 factor (ECF subfamily)
MAAVLEHTEHDASIPSEGELMKLLRSRDGAAFRLAFRLHGPLVKAIAFSVLRDRWLAEDTVQETFVALWTHADELDPALGSVAGWLHTVAHRRAVDRLRREMVRRETTERSARQRDTGLGQDPSDRVIESVDAARSRTRVREALAALPDPQREVLLRMYFRGQSGSQIARELDVPLGTVKSRARLAMLRLRESLSDPSFA